MRIGLLISGDLAALSGRQLYTRQLIAQLQSCGDHTEVLTLPPGNMMRQLATNLSRTLPQRIEAAQFDVLLQDEACYPAVIHLNRRWHGRVAYPIVSIVQRLHSGEHRAPGVREFHRSLERRYLASVDAFICHSATAQRAVCEALHRPELARSVLAYPGGDRFSAGVTSEAIQQRAHRSGPLRVVFVGDLIRRKGLLILLEALLKLPAWTCQLTVVGNTNLDATYMRIVYHLLMVTQLTGVTLTGAVDDAELATLLTQADVLVVPSEYAGFGIAYLEGMSFGLPAIGTTSGGAGEIVADGMNGYLVPPNDPAALADRLMSLASDRAKLTQMSLAARERFLAQPSWHDSMARVREALVSWTKQPWEDQRQP